ncbi:IS5/IS1182 family transposase, partial [Acinetobacter baumannii]
MTLRQTRYGSPKTYRTTNWSSYNRALINRGNISIWFDP